MDFDTQVKLAIYGHFAETGQRPSPEDMATRVGADISNVRDAYGRLRAARLLLFEDDGVSIRMAPPFSGVPTQHIVESEGVRYYANCAWDSLGIPAALQRPATVHSRCEQSGEPLHLQVGSDGPPPSDWLFHCLVPAAKWWVDLVFT
ncbi:MAG: hypothetical protein J5I90_09100 [Caldilineales bacterium]|nr:hypothetical protein [Caldilineales bacterium]